MKKLYVLFREWAEQYFAPDSGNLDMEIVENTLYEHFRGYCILKKKNWGGISLFEFSTLLDKFCSEADYIHHVEKTIKRYEEIVCCIYIWSRKKYETCFLPAPTTREGAQYLLDILYRGSWEGKESAYRRLSELISVLLPKEE
ncbi:MAG: hypothetical protein LBS20_10850 [Prevotella sp.]|jgi:hypothetical protein|nr:hypothetical protein [Prevotella sp.]